MINTYLPPKTKSLYLLSKVVSPGMAGKTATARRLRCLVGAFFAYKTIYKKFEGHRLSTLERPV